MVTNASLHYSQWSEKDFSPMLNTGLSSAVGMLLKGAAEIGAWSNKTPIKSTKIVCSRMAQTGFLYGDALYDILIRLTSPQLIRYPLFEGQGNFGWWNDETGEVDYAADACFTSARLSPLGERIAKSLRNDYSCPCLFPILLIEGWNDSHVHIPPHNLSEVIDACLAMMDKPNISLDELMDFI